MAPVYNGNINEVEGQHKKFQKKIKQKARTKIAVPKKKRTKRREVKGEWPDDKILKLIEIVEQQPMLWDISCPNYRIPKPTLWDEVAAKISENEAGSHCKSKWQSLRVQFKTNLAKTKNKKSDQDTSELATVHWRFFKAMQFIESSESKNATVSSSNSILDYSSTSTTQPEVVTIEQPSTSDNKRRKRINIITGKSPLVVTSQSKTIKNIADAVMQMMVSSDVHSAFGDHIAAELRRLPSDDAQKLKTKLTRTLLDFWDECTPQRPSIQNLDRQGCEIDSKIIGQISPAQTME